MLFLKINLYSSPQCYHRSIPISNDGQDPHQGGRKTSRCYSEIAFALHHESVVDGINCFPVRFALEEPMMVWPGTSAWYLLCKALNFDTARERKKKDEEKSSVRFAMP